MSALAQYHSLAGGRASGSDRAFDQGGRERIRQLLAAAGIAIGPQDGSGLADVDGHRCDALVVSTAVEDTVPDVATARRLGIPILHRSELLAEYVTEERTIAISGTSGKSTVTAMVFEILRAAGHDPSLLTGGNLVSLQKANYLGNAWAGGGDLLVIEADESDGSLVRYTPWIGVVLNLRLDHKPPEELVETFATFRRHTTGPFLVGEDSKQYPFAEGATVFGLSGGCDLRAEAVEVTAAGSTFEVAGVRFALPHPGEYNVHNAVAAIATCHAAGIALADMVVPLASFQGVARRFQTVGCAAGIEVIDDFAHNPDKIGAALQAARARSARERSPQPGANATQERIAGDMPQAPASERVLAIFQPHGFGPTRFLREALVETFRAHLGSEDLLWLPEIYYAGGTVTRDISSRDIADALVAAGRNVTFVAERADLAPAVAAAARPGDLILVMGARDPSLTDLCLAILEEIEKRFQTR